MFTRNAPCRSVAASLNRAGLLGLGSLALLLVLTTRLSAATVEYDLTVARREVNLTGQTVKALTINNALPGPTLRFTEGDHAVIRVHNQLDEDTSIHWHGILLPNGMDGVPFVTFPPIGPGRTFTYEFDLRQSGTYWYHSHTMLQEQRGLFGAFIIDPKARGASDQLRDQVVVLSDWTDEEPDSVLHTLKRGSEWYTLRKGSGQSLLGAARLGRLGDYFARELQRMAPMDLSDVAYDLFLLNSGPEQSLAAEPGERIRLRIIAGSSTTFFYLQFAGGPLQVIGADGLEVQPFEEERLLVGVAETYDVLITVPEGGSYEFRATPHDGSGHASLWIGKGPRQAAPEVPYPNVYVGMGDLALSRVFALTPAGAMGLPESAVRLGRFDQPGMAGMAHGDGTKEPGPMDHTGMVHDQAMVHADHDTDSMAHAGMVMEPGDGTKEPEAVDHTGMSHDQAMVHAAHDLDSKAHAGMVMEPGAPARPEPAAPPGTWLGLLAEDASSKAPLAVDGQSPERPWPPYDKLRSLQPTAFAPANPVREIRLTLEEDMERYVWFLNNAPLSEADAIEIKRGEVVRFIMINRTMMHHPMHLHGHFFRVLNGQGDYAPLKHTVDVIPMATTVIEFAADAAGDWFFHCHLLYHMESGMARLVHYRDFTPDPATAAVRPRLYHDMFHLFGQVDALANLAQGELVYANTRHILGAEWQAGWQGVDKLEWEVTPTYDYYLNRFSRIFGGVNLAGAGNHFEKHEGILGLRYLLPFNLKSRVWVDTAGEAQGAVAKHLEITPRLQLFAEAEYDTREKWDGQGGATYLISKNLTLVVQWHSDFRWGGGLRWQF